MFRQPDISLTKLTVVIMMNCYKSNRNTLTKHFVSVIIIIIMAGLQSNGIYICRVRLLVDFFLKKRWKFAKQGFTKIQEVQAISNQIFISASLFILSHIICMYVYINTYTHIRNITNIGNANKFTPLQTITYLIQPAHYYSAHLQLYTINYLFSLQFIFHEQCQ